MDIWYKHKIDIILEENCPENFLYNHHGFVSPECVLRDNVTLYALDLHEAVFMEVDESIDVCSGDVAGFVSEAQFLHAKRMYIMPISSFHRLAEKVGGPHKPLILLGNTARCGSTLVCQFFEKTGKILTLSEPTSFDTLSMYLTEKTLEPEKLDRFIVNAMRLLCKPVRKDIVAYHVKITSVAMVCMAEMHRLFPDSKLLFMYREGMPMAQSLARIAKQIPMYHLIAVMGKLHWRFTVHYMDQIGLPSDDFHVRIKHDILLALHIWAKICRTYLDFRKSNLPISAISYEDILADRKYACEQIFRYCGLPMEDVPVALEAMGRDSHANSVISRELVKSIPIPELPKELQVDADALCDKNGLPRIPGPCVLEGTITHKA